MAVLPLQIAELLAAPPTEVGLIVTLAFWLPPLAQPAGEVTTQFNDTKPEAPAVKVTVEPVCPAVIVPPVMLQLYDDAPAGTDAVLPVELAHTLAGDVMDEEGTALGDALALPED